LQRQLTDPFRLLVLWRDQRGWLLLGSLAPGTTFHHASYNNPPRATLSTLLAGDGAGATDALSVDPQLKASQELKMINWPRRITFFIFRLSSLRAAFSFSLKIHIDGQDLSVAN
jgi:hypothetical protein